MHKDNVYTRWTRLGLEQVGQAKSIDLMIGAALGPVSSMTTGVAFSGDRRTIVVILAILYFDRLCNCIRPPGQSDI